MIKKTSVYILDVQDNDLPKSIHDAIFEIGADQGWGNDAFHSFSWKWALEDSEEYLPYYHIVATYIRDNISDVKDEVLINFWW